MSDWILRQVANVIYVITNAGPRAAGAQRCSIVTRVNESCVVVWLTEMKRLMCGKINNSKLMNRPECGSVASK